MSKPGTNPMANKCPQCGASLPAGALEGLCPACLLKQGTADSATEMGGKPFEPPGVAELARLFPQLEILTLLGKGGMARSSEVTSFCIAPSTITARRLPS